MVIQSTDVYICGGPRNYGARSLGGVIGTRTENQEAALHKLQKNQPVFDLASEALGRWEWGVTEIDGVYLKTTQVFLSAIRHYATL